MEILKKYIYFTKQKFSFKGFFEKDFQYVDVGDKLYIYEEMT